MRSLAISRSPWIPLFAAGFAILALAPGESAAAPKKVPDPTKSTWDRILVGNSSGGDMGNAFHVVPRDVGNIPLAGTIVSLRFVGCTASPYAQQESGTTVDCAGRTMWRIADGKGEAVFYGRIAGFDDDLHAEIRANGVLLSRVPVRSTDLDGNGTTNVGDLNLFRQRFLFDPKSPETDFDQNGVTNAGDLVRMREEMMSHAYGDPCP